MIFGGPLGFVLAVSIYLGALYVWLPVVNAAGQTLFAARTAER